MASRRNLVVNHMVINVHLKENKWLHFNIGTYKPYKKW